MRFANFILKMVRPLKGLLVHPFLKDVTGPLVDVIKGRPGSTAVKAPWRTFREKNAVSPPPPPRVGHSEAHVIKGRPGPLAVKAPWRTFREKNAVSPPPPRRGPRGLDICFSGTCLKLNIETLLQ